MGLKWQKHYEKVLVVLACSNLIALQIGYSWLDPHPKGRNDQGGVGCRPVRSHHAEEDDVVADYLWELHQEALKKGSSLRFDWTNLPPMTPLGRQIEQSQSQCLNATAVKEYGPQQIVHFELIGSGMGSSIHTWMNPLCHAAENNKVLITGNSRWIWNDQQACADEFARKQALKSADWATTGNANSITSWDVPVYSSLWCYFGWHESALRCPPGTLAWNDSVVDHGWDWLGYSCENMHETYGRNGMQSAVAEWLFQNVSQIVIEEAERQIREEAFPVANHTNSTSRRTNDNTCNNTFQRWIGMPDANSLITVHIRWGDKGFEMDLVSIDEVVNATLSLLTPEELSGQKLVHIYLATEDPMALKMFREAALPRKWHVHASGPINPREGFSMMDAARESQGTAGLQSLAALLIALEANRYVLARGSNWSRLIDELRKSVLDSRCDNCTRMIDLREAIGR